MPTISYCLICSGIGAYAGGLEALTSVFENVTNVTGFSFVVVQHLSPDHKSLVAEVLSRHTMMKVMEAEHEMPIKPNCVYLLPSKKFITINSTISPRKSKE